MSRGPRHAYPAAFEPCVAPRRQQYIDASAVHEGHAVEVEGKPCPVSAQRAQQLFSQLRGGRDVDLPADPDDERGCGQDVHPQVGGLRGRPGGRHRQRWLRCVLSDGSHFVAHVPHGSNYRSYSNRASS